MAQSQQPGAVLFPGILDEPLGDPLQHLLAVQDHDPHHQAGLVAHLHSTPESGSRVSNIDQAWPGVTSELNNITDIGEH